MISFVEKTWFLWWLLATLMILRWFQLFSSETSDDRVVSSYDDEQAGAAASRPVPSGSASRRPFPA